MDPRDTVKQAAEMCADAHVTLSPKVQEAARRAVSDAINGQWQTTANTLLGEEVTQLSQDKLERARPTPEIKSGCVDVKRLAAQR